MRRRNPIEWRFKSNCPCKHIELIDAFRTIWTLKGLQIGSIVFWSETFSVCANLMSSSPVDWIRPPPTWIVEIRNRQQLKWDIFNRSIASHRPARFRFVHWRKSSSPFGLNINQWPTPGTRHRSIWDNYWVHNWYLFEFNLNTRPPQDAGSVRWKWEINHTSRQVLWGAKEKKIRALVGFLFLIYSPVQPSGEGRNLHNSNIEIFLLIHRSA